MFFEKREYLPVGSPSNSPPKSCHRVKLLSAACVLVLLVCLVTIAPYSLPASQTTTATVNTARDQLPMSYQLESGEWTRQLENALTPNCETTARMYYERPNMRRTGFVTSPRSGNTWTRTMVERATGYLTSSVYCDDETLMAAFPGTCSNNTFFIKDHAPIFVENLDEAELRQKYDQIVHLIRNPFDSIASWYHLEKSFSHSGRIENVAFNNTIREDVIPKIAAWDFHTRFWLSANVPALTLTYEDLRAQTFPQMLRVLAFILPQEDQPSLERIACTLRLDLEHNAYATNRASPFETFDLFDKEMQDEIFSIVSPLWCRLDFNRHFEKAKGWTPVDCKRSELLHSREF